MASEGLLYRADCAAMSASCRWNGSGLRRTAPANGLLSAMTRKRTSAIRATTSAVMKTCSLRLLNRNSYVNATVMTASQPPWKSVQMRWTRPTYCPIRSG